MTTEQRRALANTTPTTDAIRDAVTFPRDRLGEPLDISPERFAAWLARVRRDAAREALDGLAEDAEIDVRLGAEGGDNLRAQNAEAVIDAATIYRDTEYPEETP